jgi:hypothetical protein
MHTITGSGALHPAEGIQCECSFTTLLDWRHIMAAKQLEYRVTAVFRNAADAAAAYLWLRRRFDESHVIVLLSDQSRDAFHEAVRQAPLEADRESTPEAEASGAAGVAVGAGMFALAGVALSGVGLLAVGPIAAALAGGTVGAMVGPLVGGLVGYGFPETSARAYAGLLETGATAVGVLTHDQQQVELVRQHFERLRGEQVIVL